MFKMTDVLPEIYKEFPEIDEKAIAKICRTGLIGINKLLRSDEEVVIRGDRREDIKFFIPCGPAVQDELSRRNRSRRYFREKNKANGTGTTTTIGSEETGSK